MDLGAAEGSEAARARPAVVVSNDGANSSASSLGRGVVTVVPITGNVGDVYPFQVLLDPAVSGLPRPSKAQAEQVRAVAVHRLADPPLGTLPPAVMADLDRALLLHLGLDRRA